MLDYDFGDLQRAMPEIGIEIELLGLQVPEFWQLPGAGVGNKSLYWAPQWYSGSSAFYY